jgi:flagellar protein FliS
MSDAIALYRTAQAATSNPTERIVLLYEGAIRFGVRHVDALEHDDREAAHAASIRCQQIIAELQEVLNFEAGTIAHKLDALYRFMLDRLAAGNVSHDPQPTTEVLGLLRDLLGTWQEVGRVVRNGARLPIAPPSREVADPRMGAAMRQMTGARPITA